MHVITQTRLKKFWNVYPDAQGPLTAWYKLITKGTYQNFVKLCKTFPSADKVKNLIVFNIGGNKYRLIVYIDFEDQKVFIRHILTHVEYDTEDWKNDSWYPRP